MDLRGKEGRNFHVQVQRFDAACTFKSLIKATAAAAMVSVKVTDARGKYICMGP